MKIINILKFILSSEHSHFISVDKKIYQNWKYLIILAVKFNKRYKSVEIFRKKFKSLEDFVVVGLKYNGKNVRRRTVGFAKDFVEQNEDARCIYCDSKLTTDNATADHIVPISKGGNNSQVNLIVVCSDCNNQRGDLDFNDYLRIKNPNYINMKLPII